MHYSKIEAHEQRFVSQLSDSSGTKYSEEIINEDGFEFHRIRPIGIDEYYVKEETKKDMIVLHLTEGYLKGDLAALVKQTDTVCTNFVVGRNGVVYELFDQNYWGWHLGRAALGGNKLGSKRSIAIELSNAGVLEKRGDFLYDYNSKYCSLEDTEQYIKLDKPFRGEQYFATCTDAQYESTSALIDYLCKKHKISRKMLPVKKRYELFSNSEEAKSYKGISSHANFRKSGKWDIGPAFDWLRIVSKKKKVSAPTDTVIDLEEVHIKSETQKETQATKGLFELMIDMILGIFK